MATKVISKTTVNRLISDIREVKRSNLPKEGIHYKHDESDMLLGYAVVIGPPSTPYAYGYYCFKFEFPIDYPHSPPTLVYLTNDGHTRFNPNFYKDGKVCISALNTWKGEQWTGCNTIKSILLILCSLLNSMPLLNEPGISSTHKDHIPYNKLLTYKNFDIAICGILNQRILPDKFNMFNDILISTFMENYEKIKHNLETIINNNNNNKNNNKNTNLELVVTDFYNLRANCNYSQIIKSVNKIYMDIINNKEYNLLEL